MWICLLLIFKKKSFEKLGAKKSTLAPFLKYLTSLPDSMVRHVFKSGREVGGGAITILKIKVELK